MDLKWQLGEEAATGEHQVLRRAQRGAGWAVTTMQIYPSFRPFGRASGSMNEHRFQPRCGYSHSLHLTNLARPDAHCVPLELPVDQALASFSLAIGADTEEKRHD